MILIQTPLKGVGSGVIGLGFAFVLFRWFKRLRVSGVRQPSIDELKMLFGFLLLLVVAFLCAAIAMGTVKEESSFGLTQMITVLAALGGGFSTWAFSSGPNRTKEDEKERTGEEKSDS